MKKARIYGRTLASHCSSHIYLIYLSENLTQANLGSINRKPKVCVDIYLSFRSGAKGASSTLTSYSTKTNAMTKFPVFQGVAQMIMTANKWGNSPLHQPKAMIKKLFYSRLINKNSLNHNSYSFHSIDITFDICT